MTCIHCGSAGPFYHDPRRAKPSRVCMGCMRRSARDRAKQWYNRHAELRRAITRNSQLRTKFGITALDYEFMLEQQDGRCAVCRGFEVAATAHDPTRLRGLAVDHDPTTGRIRGLLCSKCNRGLGMFDHDPSRMEQAIRYLTAEGVRVAATK